MQLIHADLVHDARATLGEGPVWLADQQRLLWVDIEGQTVNRWDPATGRNAATPVGQRVGMALPADDGQIYYAGEHGLWRLDAEGRRTFLQDPEAGLPTRFNDGKVDPAGRLWAGTMSLVRQDHQGSLYRFDHPSRPAHRVLIDVTTSNGLAWSADRRTFYYIDTRRQRVEAFAYDDASGHLSGRRTVAAFVKSEVGSPDGMCIDDAGRLWVAHWGGGRVSCIDPATGACVAEVRVPAQNVTSCCFGGPQRDILYITSARQGTAEEVLTRLPHCGGIFAARVGTSGPPTTLLKL
jgi:sugar lactone lactonase YvrE